MPKRRKVNEYEFMPEDKNFHSSRRKKATLKLGGQFAHVHQISTIKNPYALEKEIMKTQAPRTYTQRQIDELNNATWRINQKGEEITDAERNRPAQKVNARTLEQKNKQEYNKKIAMHKFKNPYGRTLPQGHNLRLGQPDGDAGRKKASQTRGKK